jgi:hypothetical protein
MRCGSSVIFLGRLEMHVCQRVQGQRREAEGVKGWEVGMPKIEVLTVNYR